VLVTHVAGEPEADAGAKTRVRGEDEIAVAEPLVEAIRPRLLSRFRGLSSADLAVSGIFLAASKPA
jgi:hypothetical protein